MAPIASIDQNSQQLSQQDGACVVTYQVNGMTCGHCSQAVTAEVSRIGGVQRVEVDVATGQVTVASDTSLDVQDVREAIEEAGYQLA